VRQFVDSFLELGVLEMPHVSQTRTELRTEIETTRIRDLSEMYPETMPVFASFGFDICCGGELTPPEAATAHQIDPEAVVESALQAILGSERPE
jgi:iron-sulfur cluster repair protein YtfE (RIC family)